MIILNKWEGIHLSSFMFLSATFVVSGYWITHIVLSLSGRVVLAFTAWQETSRRLKDTVIHLFVKCGIAMPISGSRDSEINIDGLPDYRLGAWISRCTGNRILLWLKGGKPNLVLLVHDKQMYFMVQYTEVSVLTWTNVPFVDMNF